MRILPFRSDHIAEAAGLFVASFRRQCQTTPAILASIYVTGACVRPEYRGRKAAAAMLNAALIDYSGRGFTCCAVDFESFNPEAASFWMRYFAPVRLSVMRAPE